MKNNIFVKMLFLLFGMIMLLSEPFCFHAGAQTASAGSVAMLKKIYKEYDQFLEKKQFKEFLTTKEYKEFMLGAFGKYKHGQYAIYDIDKNGVPELMVAGNDSTGTSPVYLFTYKNNNVSYIGKIEFGDISGGSMEFPGLEYDPVTKGIWLVGGAVDMSAVLFEYDGTHIEKKQTLLFDDTEEDFKAAMAFHKGKKDIKFYWNFKSERQKSFGASINRTSLLLSKTERFKLKISTNQIGKIKWSSSNKKVAVVDSKGWVTGKGTGQAKITARVGISTLVCKIKVYSFENNRLLKKYAFGKWKVSFGDFSEYVYKFNQYNWGVVGDIYITKVYKNKSNNIYIIAKSKKDSNLFYRLILYKKKNYKAGKMQFKRTGKGKYANTFSQSENLFVKKL